jgi:hypothetical protein
MRDTQDCMVIYIQSIILTNRMTSTSHDIAKLTEFENYQAVGKALPLHTQVFSSNY